MSGIGPDFIGRVVTQMIGLKYLQSLRYLSINSDDLRTSNISEADFDRAAQLDQYLFSTNTPMLPPQYSLKPIIFPCLRHLVLKETTTNLIKNIALVMPELRSFDTILLLNRLILRIPGEIFRTGNILNILNELFRSLCFNEHIGTDDVESPSSSTSVIDFTVTRMLSMVNVGKS